MAEEKAADMNSVDKVPEESNFANDAQATASSKSKSSEKLSSKKKSKNIIDCKISTLDGTELEIEVDRDANGEVLFSKVVDRLNILEKDYFGLKFTDTASNVVCWLDLHKRIRKQLNRSPPNFQFAVKFYEPEPARLLDEYTRYLLYLQLRDDVVEGRLQCSQNTYALLGSYTAQAEFGDYDPVEHRDDYLDEYQFTPEEEEELIYRIQDLHRGQRGQSPAQAELNYLEVAKAVPRYGTSLCKAKDDKKQEVQIGVSYIGIAVYRDGELGDSFTWPTVLVIAFRRKKFTVRLKPPEDRKQKIKRNHSFKLESTKAAKQLYKASVEFHTFFRLSRPDPPRKKREPGFGSKFRYSDRTLYELRRQPSVTERRGIDFTRSPSKKRTASSRSRRTPERKPLSPVASPEIEEEKPEELVPPKYNELYEEIEIDDSQPEDYNKDEWEIIEKVSPDGTVKRYRRRIIKTESVTKTTVTTTTPSPYGIRKGTEEDQSLLESKPISPVVPVEDSEEKSEEKVEDSTSETVITTTTTTVITEEIVHSEAKEREEPSAEKVETEPVSLAELKAASKKPSAAVKPLLREDLNTTTPSPTEPLSPIKIIVYDADTEETKKILSPEEKEAERQKAEEEELNKRNAEETEEAKSVSPPTPVIEEVTLGIDGDESFDSIKIAHVVFNKTPTPDEYDEYEDEVILEKANLSKVSSTSEDNLTAEDTRQVKTLDRKFFRRAPPERSYRRSYGDELDDYGRGTRTMPRKGAKKVSLITRDELLRTYSQGGLAQKNVVRDKSEEEIAPEINYSLKAELGLQADQGERGFVKNIIGQHEKIRKEEETWKKEQIQRRSRSSLTEDHPAIKGAVPTRSTSFREVEETTIIKTREPPPVKVKPVVFHPDTSGEAAVFEEANQGGLDSSSAGGDGDPRRESGTYNVPQVETKTIVFDESAPPISESDTKGAEKMDPEEDSVEKLTRRRYIITKENRSIKKYPENKTDNERNNVILENNDTSDGKIDTFDADWKVLRPEETLKTEVVTEDVLPLKKDFCGPSIKVLQDRVDILPLELRPLQLDAVSKVDQPAKPERNFIVTEHCFKPLIMLRNRNRRSMIDEPLEEVFVNPVQCSDWSELQDENVIREGGPVKPGEVTDVHEETVITSTKIVTTEYIREEGSPCRKGENKSSSWKHETVQDVNGDIQIEAITDMPPVEVSSVKKESVIERVGILDVESGIDENSTKEEIKVDPKNVGNQSNKVKIAVGTIQTKVDEQEIVTAGELSAGVHIDISTAEKGSSHNKNTKESFDSGEQIRSSPLAEENIFSFADIRNSIKDSNALEPAAGNVLENIIPIVDTDEIETRTSFVRTPDSGFEDVESHGTNGEIMKNGIVAMCEEIYEPKMTSSPLSFDKADLINEKMIIESAAGSNSVDKQISVNTASVSDPIMKLTSFAEGYFPEIKTVLQSNFDSNKDFVLESSLDQLKTDSELKSVPSEVTLSLTEKFPAPTSTKDESSTDESLMNEPDTLDEVAEMPDQLELTVTVESFKESSLSDSRVKTGEETSSIAVNHKVNAEAELQSEPFGGAKLNKDGALLDSEQQDEPNQTDETSTETETKKRKKKKKNSKKEKLQKMDSLPETKDLESDDITDAALENKQSAELNPEFTNEKLAVESEQRKNKSVSVPDIHPDSVVVDQRKERTDSGSISTCVTDPMAVNDNINIEKDESSPSEISKNKNKKSKKKRPKSMIDRLSQPATDENVGNCTTNYKTSADCAPQNPVTSSGSVASGEVSLKAEPKVANACITETGSKKKKKKKKRPKSMIELGRSPDEQHLENKENSPIFKQPLSGAASGNDQTEKPHFPKPQVSSPETRTDQLSTPLASAEIFPIPNSIARVDLKDKSKNNKGEEDSLDTPQSNQLPACQSSCRNVAAGSQVGGEPPKQSKKKRPKSMIDQVSLPATQVNVHNGTGDYQGRADFNPHSPISKPITGRSDDVKLSTEPKLADPCSTKTGSKKKKKKKKRPKSMFELGRSSDAQHLESKEGSPDCNQPLSKTTVGNDPKEELHSPKPLISSARATNDELSKTFASAEIHTKSVDSVDLTDKDETNKEDGDSHKIPLGNQLQAGQGICEENPTPQSPNELEGVDRPKKNKKKKSKKSKKKSDVEKQLDSEDRLDPLLTDQITGIAVDTTLSPLSKLRQDFHTTVADFLGERAGKEPGIVQTQTVAISAPNHVRTVETKETVITKTLPTEVTTETIVIDADTSNMDPDELKKLMEMASSDGVVTESVVTTTVKTTQQTVVIGETVTVTGEGETNEATQKKPDRQVMKSLMNVARILQRLSHKDL